MATTPVGQRLALDALDHLRADLVARALKRHLQIAYIVEDEVGRRTVHLHGTAVQYAARRVIDVENEAAPGPPATVNADTENGIAAPGIGIVFGTCGSSRHPGVVARFALKLRELSWRICTKKT